MNIFESTNYREIIEKVVQERKRLDPDLSFQSLAHRIGVQPSYLSKVVRGSADLSSDQLFLICECLEFNEGQRGYLELLLEHSRSGLAKRREELAKKISRIQSRNLEAKEHLRTKHQIAAGDSQLFYYLDPLHQIVHISLTIERYRKSLPTLARDLGIPSARLAAIVSKLESMGLVENKQGKISVLLDQVHMPRDFPHYPVWLAQLRQLCIHRIQNGPRSDAYSFSVVFTADEKMRLKIQARFLDLLSEIEPWVRDCPPEETFQLNFDLFGWTRGAS